MARVTKPLDVRRGFKSAADYLAEERAKSPRSKADALAMLQADALAILQAAWASSDPGPLTAELDDDGVVWLFTADGAPHSMMSIEAFRAIRQRAESRRGTDTP
jgi:hypothetical protein